MAGSGPDLEVEDGVVTVRCTETPHDQWHNPHYQQWGPPRPWVSFPVGAALGKVLQDDDALTVMRGGAAALSVVVFRRDVLQAAIGAVSHFPLQPEVTIEEDPRADEQRLYGVAATLRRPRTSLIWVDAARWNVESLHSRIVQAGGERLVFAIAGSTRQERRQVNNAIASSRLGRGFSSCHYADVDERFSSPDEWRTYIEALPTRRPADLWIRFNCASESTALREGDHALVPPWHLFVLRVNRPGIPGDPSQLAIVRVGPNVTKEMVIRSTELVAQGQIRFPD